MNLYAESSALLAWLLAEPGDARIREALDEAHVVTSELSLLECERTLVRAVSLGEMKRSDAEHKREALRLAASSWPVLRMDAEVWERAKLPFPHEPLHALDALHLACVLLAARGVPDLGLLCLDRRLRKAAQGAGIRLYPVVGQR